MKIGHVQKTSFIDYPGRISAVVFTQGCNFRCPYCHNPELVDKKLYTEAIVQDDVYSFLAKRRGKLEAVVITGGEPTLQKGLMPFMQRVKSMGYLIKLDTNGSRPSVVQDVLEKNLVDYIAMDVKAPWDKYSAAAGSLVDITHIRKSISLIMSSGIEYEFRTTIVKSLLKEQDVLNIGKIIKGARLYVLQKFVASKHLDKKITESIPYTDSEMVQLSSELRSIADRCIVR